MRKIIIVIVLLGLLVGGAFAGRRGYRAWKEHRAIANAQEALAKPDFKEALLWLRKALQANANNIEATRLMGDFAESVQSPNTVHWRSRLVDLEPHSLTNRLLLARTAILNREYETAKKALDGVDDAGQKTAEYHKAYGAFAVATGQYLEAEKHFGEACKQQPTNPVPQLNLAMIQVQRKDPELAAQARAQLQGLATNPVVRPDALRHLTLDALRHTNLSQAVILSTELARETNILFSDRLLQLDVLRAARSPQLQPTLTRLQQQVNTNATRIYELSRWMLAASGPSETMTWIQTISPNIRTNLPVTMIVADAYLGTTNWTGLQAYVSKQQWGEMDYMRLALHARTLREQNMETTAKAEWNKTMSAAVGRLDRLIVLQRLTAAWRWPIEREEVLFAIVNKFPAERDAFAALSNLLQASGKTRLLLTLYAQGFASHPDNLVIKNNLAALALLLEAPEYRPQDLAREVYEKQSTNANFAATYAFSLYRQKKPKEALEVINRLTPEQQELPSVALYYALFLAETGDKATAKKYADLSAKGQLLPEETQLLQRLRL